MEIWTQVFGVLLRSLQPPGYMLFQSLARAYELRAQTEHPKGQMHPVAPRPALSPAGAPNLGGNQATTLGPRVNDQMW